jgi:hypothetical protein
MIATPIDLARLIPIARPTARVTYELEEHDRGALASAIRGMFARRPGATHPKQPPRPAPAALRSATVLTARRGVAHGRGH